MQARLWTLRAARLRPGGVEGRACPLKMATVFKRLVVQVRT
jgi:hypothetical protein